MFLSSLISFHREDAIIFHVYTRVMKTMFYDDFFTIKSRGLLLHEIVFYKRLKLTLFSWLSLGVASIQSGLAWPQL